MTVYVISPSSSSPTNTCLHCHLFGLRYRRGIRYTGSGSLGDDERRAIRRPLRGVRLLHRSALKGVLARTAGDTVRCGVDAVLYALRI
jgi:hypothetical protein